MKATTFVRWLIALFVLCLVTTNLLAQPVPPHPPSWDSAYPGPAPADPYPAPPCAPSPAEPYPWPTRGPVEPYRVPLAVDSYAWPSMAPVGPYPAPPPLDPYPWPTTAPVEAYLPYPIIPTRTPTVTDPGPGSSDEGLRRLLYNLDGPCKSPAMLLPTPTRDPGWEAEFHAVHNRLPEAQDVADRDWSLTFLSQTGRPPTEAEWEAHYYGRP